MTPSIGLSILPRKTAGVPLRSVILIKKPLYLAAMLFGTLVAETILASVHVRTRQKAGHMGASDLIKALQKHLARRGPSTYVRVPVDRDHRFRSKMIIEFGGT